MKHFATQMNEKFVVLCNHTINDENHFTTDRDEIDCQHCAWLLRETNLLWLMEILTESSIGMNAFREKKPQAPTKEKRKKARSKKKIAADKKKAQNMRDAKAERKANKEAGTNGITAPLTKKSGGAEMRPSKGAPANFKLNEQRVMKILDLIDQEIPRNEIARRFGCSGANITLIANGSAWKQVERPLGFQERETARSEARKAKGGNISGKNQHSPSEESPMPPPLGERGADL